MTMECFFFGFLRTAPGRVSQVPTDETYAGAFPYSEVENLFITEAMMALQPQLQGMFSFHSYGLMWLLPWAYSRELPPDYNDLVSRRIWNTNLSPLHWIARPNKEKYEL